jgi:sugar phosphate permease
MASSDKQEAAIENIEDVSDQRVASESALGALHPTNLMSHLDEDVRKILDDPEALSAWMENYESGSEEEKRMVRKIDWHMMPILWIMYVFNYLDRTNIGNAKVAGMNADLHMDTDPNKYSVALLVFFVGYLLFEVPSNMILSKSKPAIYLPSIMFIWGCMTITYMAVRTFSGLVVLRFFLGIVESGFFPGAFCVQS